MRSWLGRAIPLSNLARQQPGKLRRLAPEESFHRANYDAQDGESNQAVLNPAAGCAQYIDSVVEQAGAVPFFDGRLDWGRARVAYKVDAGRP